MESERGRWSEESERGERGESERGEGDGARAERLWPMHLGDEVGNHWQSMVITMHAPER